MMMVTVDGGVDCCNNIMMFIATTLVMVMVTITVIT